MSTWNSLRPRLLSDMFEPFRCILSVSCSKLVMRNVVKRANCVSLFRSLFLSLSPPQFLSHPLSFSLFFSLSPSLFLFFRLSPSLSLSAGARFKWADRRQGWWRPPAPSPTPPLRTSIIANHSGPCTALPEPSANHVWTTSSCRFYFCLLLLLILLLTRMLWSLNSSLSWYILFNL